MPQEQQTLSLSPMEELRLYRAIYRFQVYCTLFGSGRASDSLTDQHERFLASFPPWEVLEMACVWYYLVCRWASIMKDLSLFKFKWEQKGATDRRRFEDACLDASDGYLSIYGT